MAAFRTAIVVVMTLVVIGCSSWQRAEAATDCSTALAGLLGCSTFLTNTSSTPDQKTCCAPLESVLTTPSSFQCLCAQASSSDTQAYKNALLLPAACKLSINVSTANCTQTSSSSNSSTSTPSRDRNAGSMRTSSLLHLAALALLWACVSFFA